MEFVADAIEKGAFQEGPQKGSVQKAYTLPDGTPIFKTGDPVIDKLEEEFAAKAMAEIAEERRQGISRRHIPTTSDDSKSASDVPLLGDEELLEAMDRIPFRT